MTTNSRPITIRFYNELRNARLAEAVNRGGQSNPIAQQTAPSSSTITNRLDSGSPATTTPASAPVPPAIDRSQVVQLLDQLHAKIEELEKRRCETHATVNLIATELAIAVAAKILFREVERDEFPIQEMIAQLLNDAGLADASESTTPVRIFLNPADLAIVEKDSELGSSLLVGSDSDPASKVRWVASVEIPRGTARMDADGFSLSCDGVVQLQEIRQHLLEMLNDSQIERRRASNGDSKIKRFPDRRASG